MKTLKQLKQQGGQGKEVSAADLGEETTEIEEIVENSGVAATVSMKSTSASRPTGSNATQEWEEAVQTTPKSQLWADEVEESPELNRKGSVWDNFDLTKTAKAGFKLEFVTPEKQGESSICEIDIEDISTEIAYWQHAVVCYVLGAHPPLSVMNGYIQRLWGKHGINKVSMLKNGIVLVRFDSGMGKDEVLQGGIYHFDNKPLIVKAWSPDMEFTREELYTVPIWVKLLGLDSQRTE
ncbi:hypothetical protein KY289_030185 [Solanum tuberosum]|nr:hypothetical protein KY289_030185 [Solanum tuberosum]